MARAYSERPRRSPILHPTRRFFRYHGMEESYAFRLSSRELQLVEVIADIQHGDPERDAGTHLTWRAQRDGYRSPYPIYAVHALHTHGPRVSKPTSFVHLQRYGHIERTTISSPHTEETTGLVTSNRMHERDRGGPRKCSFRIPPPRLGRSDREHTVAPCTSIPKALVTTLQIFRTSRPPTPPT